MDKLKVPTIKEIVMKNREKRETVRKKSKKRTSLYREKMKVYK